MHHAIRPFLSLVLAVAAAGGLGACKTERTVVESKQEMGSILQKFAGNYQIERSADGTATMKSERRSDFESKAFAENGRDARMDKKFQTKGYNTKEVERKSFAGSKTFATKDAKESGQRSKWQMPWKGVRKSAREADKKYDTGEAYATDMANDADKVFPTRDEPKTLKRWDYPDKALENIRTPGAGEGSGPSIRDVRGLIGKDG